MCWSNYMAIPIVLKKPLKVYKVGSLTVLDGFMSLYQNFVYRKFKTMPTVKINPKFERYSSDIGYLEELWNYDRFYIHEGYHSYLTEEMAKNRMCGAKIGIFEIPAGATVYVNYVYREVVSTDIKYLGLLECRHSCDK